MERSLFLSFPAAGPKNHRKTGAGDLAGYSLPFWSRYDTESFRSRRLGCVILIFTGFRSLL